MCEAPVVQDEQAVAETFAIGQDVVGCIESRGAGDDGRPPRDVYRNHRHVAATADRDSQLLRPEQAALQRILHRHRHPRHLALTVERRRHVEARPATLFHPGAAPGREVSRRAGIEQAYQIEPCGIAERVLPQIVTQAGLQRRLAENQLELPHDDRSFLIDDRPVQSPRFVQIGERLADGIGALRPVHAVRGRIVRQQEPQVVIQLRERGVHDLRGHEVREHLFHPHVVEPAHGHEIAEPHVGRLVRDDAGAIELLRLRRRLVEQQRRRVVEDRAWMLHAAELERRNQHDVELAERIGDPGVALHPVDGGRMQVEDGVTVARDLGGVRFAVEQA